MQQSGLDLGSVEIRRSRGVSRAIAIAPAPRPPAADKSPPGEIPRPPSPKMFDPTITRGFVVSSWSGPFRPSAGTRCVTCKGTRFWSPWAEPERGLLCRRCKSPDNGQAIAEEIDTAPPPSD
jgi:hypothetical protein